MLLEQIKQDSLTARRASDTVAKNLLLTLYSEALNVGKNDGNRETTNAETLAVIRKFLKNVNENISVGAQPVEQFEREAEILTGYLPQQMTEEELENQIEILVEALGNQKSMKQVGVVMSNLKTQFEGLYDSAVAINIVKEKLNA